MRMALTRRRRVMRMSMDNKEQEEGEECDGEAWVSTETRRQSMISSTAEPWQQWWRGWRQDWRCQDSYTSKHAEQDESNGEPNPPGKRALAFKASWNDNHLMISSSIDIHQWQGTNVIVNKKNGNCALDFKTSWNDHDLHLSQLIFRAEEDDSHQRCRCPCHTRTVVLHSPPLPWSDNFHPMLYADHN